VGVIGGPPLDASGWPCKKRGEKDVVCGVLETLYWLAMPVKGKNVVLWRTRNFAVAVSSGCSRECCQSVVSTFLQYLYCSLYGRPDKRTA
jgi:hypothetical protein